MKRLILMLVLGGLVITSAGCGIYRPNVGYELGISTEGDVGSITLYLPVLTYKKKPVEEILKSLQGQLEGRKKEGLKSFEEYEVKYEEAKKNKEEAEKSLKEAEVIYNETKKRVEGAEEKVDAKVYYERAVREGKIARDPEYEKKIKGPEPQDWENYHNSQIDLLGKQNNYSYWSMEMERCQEDREDTKKHYEWIKGVNLEFIDTKHGKMLKIFIPDRGYNEWYYDFEGGGDLPYAAKSCKERTARDDFRISPRFETGEKPVVVVEEDGKTMYNKVTEKHDRVVFSGDTITTTSISTFVYAEFEKGTVTVSIEMAMKAPFGWFWSRWPNSLIDRLHPYGWPNEESDWVGYKKSSIVMNTPGWYTLPMKERIRISVYPAEPYKLGKEYD